MKKTLALLLAVLMTLSLCPTTVLAAGNDVIDGEMGVEDSIFGIIDQGPCGTDAKWIFYDDGILLITGSGDMEDYISGDEAPWAAYTADITRVIVREAITHIGAYAFAGCSHVTAKLTLHEGLASIGDGAFSGCSGLPEVTFGGTDIPDLGDDLFAGAAALETVHVPVAAYGAYAAALRPLVPANATIVPVGDITFAQAFPDPVFRKYVTDNVLCISSEDKSDSAVISDAQMEIIGAYTQIDLSKNQLDSLQGLEYFTALNSLNCAQSTLTALDLRSNPNLSYICYAEQRPVKTDIAVVQQGDTWTLDMAAFLGENGDVQYVTMTDGGVLENGIVTYTAKPETVRYTYNTGKGEMDVTWTAIYDEEEHIHSFRYSWREDTSGQTCVGSCICGEQNDLMTLNRLGDQLVMIGTVPEDLLLFAAVYSSESRQMIDAFRITDAPETPCSGEGILYLFLLDGSYRPLIEAKIW